MTNVFILTELFRNRPLKKVAVNVVRGGKKIVGQDLWDYQQPLQRKYPKGVVYLTLEGEDQLVVIFVPAEIKEEEVASWLEKEGSQIVIKSSFTQTGSFGRYKF